MSVNKAQQTIREELKALKMKMEDLKSKIISRTFADKLTVKIGEKGNLVVYGLGRFPVSLYSSQASRLSKLLNSTEFQEFIQTNSESLAKKAE
jgi:D-arabinose 5-phosphate isomerase GutQ